MKVGQLFVCSHFARTEIKYLFLEELKTAFKTPLCNGKVENDLKR